MYAQLDANITLFNVNIIRMVNRDSILFYFTLFSAHNIYTGNMQRISFNPNRNGTHDVTKRFFLVCSLSSYCRYKSPKKKCFSSMWLNQLHSRIADFEPESFQQQSLKQRRKGKIWNIFSFILFGEIVCIFKCFICHCGCIDSNKLD